MIVRPRDLVHALAAAEAKVPVAYFASFVIWCQRARFRNLKVTFRVRTDCFASS